VRGLEVPYFVTLAGLPLLKKRHFEAATVSRVAAVARPVPSRPLAAHRGAFRSI